MESLWRHLNIQKPLATLIYGSICPDISKYLNPSGDPVPLNTVQYRYVSLFDSFKSFFFNPPVPCVIFYKKGDGNSTRDNHMIYCLVPCMYWLFAKVQTVFEGRASWD